MPNRFFVPDDDEDEFSSPATPAGVGANRGNMFRFENTNSTTPGGLPPPSSAGSFTPAGAPSASYLGSSMMRGMTGTAKSTASGPAPTPTARKIFHGGSTAGGSSGLRGGAATNSPLGRSIQGGKPGRGLGATRQPSRLSQMVVGDEEDEEEEEEEEDAEGEYDDEEDAEGDEDEYPPQRKTAASANRHQYEQDDEEDDEDEYSDEEDDAEGEEDDYERQQADGGHDPWMSIAQNERAPWMPAGGYDDGAGELGAAGDNGLSLSDHNSDLMMFATPAANERIRKEAEDIFRASMARSGGVAPASRASVRAPRQYRYAPIAKGMYNQMGYAPVVEAPELIRQTEVRISQLYAEGVGAEDDPDRLDQALGDASAQLVGLWQAYADSLPKPHEGGAQAHENDGDDDEQFASIGPGPQASAFENAAYVATLALQLHHTRSASSTTGGGIDGLSPPAEPLTETLFRWMADYHNVYPDQVSDVLRYRPGPASHGMFWQTVFVSLLQGRVEDAIELLRAAGWESVRRAGIPAYSGRALANVERAVLETIGMLETCPGKTGNWEIWGSEWTLFRIRAKGALDHLRRFAEGGRGGGSFDALGEEDGEGEDEFGDSFRSSGGGGGGGLGRQSMAGMARKAESQVPWDIYENLNIVFDIALGSRERILSVSQDWCEATLGLLGWWDEAKMAPSAGAHAGHGSTFRHSKSLSMSMSLAHRNDAAYGGASSTVEAYVDRLTRSFRATTDAGLEINTNSALEVALACIFEDNPRGMIGLVRAWSLPVASAVVEIASLGGWLPAQTSTSALATAMGDLDMEDLELLGVDPTDPDEADGLKDNTLIQYAQALVNDKALRVSDDERRRDSGRDSGSDSGDVAESSSSPASMEGWELAVHVLGRMDSQERAEETIGELVRTVLEMIDVDSGSTVDKVWRLLSDLGMSAFAEEVADHYGDLLTSKSYRFGEAVWYFAVAHRPAKVREVMNLLMSYSLIQSAAYPAEADLDDHLRRLLFERRATLEQLARRDLDAAEILGRLLSGYATLRHFYNVRDDASLNISHVRRRTAAAAALTAVISSADDNIRGGLYDGSRDAVVSEDFLLALLGEALVFTEATPSSNSLNSSGAAPTTATSLVTAPPVLAADTVDALLKAVEDLQTLVGSRVFTACDEFFQVVLASAPGGLRGSTPADLLRRNTSNQSAGTSASSSYVLSGSSMLASQLHRSMSAKGGVNSTAAIQRGWDWRTGLPANTTAGDILQRVRVGLSRALARLWVAEADEMVGLPGLGGNGSLVVGRS